MLPFTSNLCYLIYQIRTLLAVDRNTAEVTKDKSEGWFEQLHLPKKSGFESEHIAIRKQDHKIPVAGVWPYDKNILLKMVVGKHDIRFPADGLKIKPPDEAHINEVKPIYTSSGPLMFSQRLWSQNARPWDRYEPEVWF